MPYSGSRKSLWGLCVALTLAIAGFFLSTAPLRAQAVTATINGTITDPSGAAVGGAKVTATDTQRGTVYTADVCM